MLSRCWAYWTWNLLRNSVRGTVRSPPALRLGNFGAGGFPFGGYYFPKYFRSPLGKTIFPHFFPHKIVSSNIFPRGRLFPYLKYFLFSLIVSPCGETILARFFPSWKIISLNFFFRWGNIFSLNLFPPGPVYPQKIFLGEITLNTFIRGKLVP